MGKNIEFDWLNDLEPIKTNEPKNHDKCLLESSGWETIEWVCGYDTTIDCDECRYGHWGGRKKPDAKCNLRKNEKY